MKTLEHLRDKVKAKCKLNIWYHDNSAYDQFYDAINYIMEIARRADKYPSYRFDDAEKELLYNSVRTLCVSRLSEIGRAIGLELCNKFKWFDIDMNFVKTIRKPADLDNEYTEAQLTELIGSLKHELMNNLRYAPEKKIVCNRIYELEFLRSQLKYGVTV